jgi:hypothetical protein
MQQLSLSLTPAMTPATIREYRKRAGLTQAQAATLTMLAHKIRWSEYERGVATMDVARWELFLLLTGQHPHYAPLVAR